MFNIQNTVQVVVLSLVRSNPRGEVGFLAESRRINVRWGQQTDYRHMRSVFGTDCM